MKTLSYRVIVTGYEKSIHPISVLRMIPDGEPRYILQVIHGIAEHKGRYLPLLEYMASRGAEVIIHDLPGHGESVPSMDRLGIMPDPGYDYDNLRAGIEGVFASIIYADAGQRVTEDESGVTVTVPSPESMDFPAVPRYLLGHSMGALIAGMYTARLPYSLAGLLLTGLPCRHRSVQPGIFLMHLLAGLYGEEAQVNWIGKAVFQAYNKPFTPEPQSDGQFLWLSNDIDNRYEFMADPLCNAPKAICTLTTLLTMVRDFHSSSFWDMPCPDLPILLLAGDQDPVAGGEKQILADQKFLRDIGFKNVSARLYRGFRHEILLDWCREEAFADVFAFCEEHLEDANRIIARPLNEYKPQFSPASADVPSSDSPEENT